MCLHDGICDLEILNGSVVVLELLYMDPFSVCVFDFLHI